MQAFSRTTPVSSPGLVEVVGAARGRNARLRDARELKGGRVAGEDVAAGALEDEGIFGRDGVKIPAREQTVAVLVEIVLIPAHAVEHGARRRTAAGDVVAAALLHVRDARGAEKLDRLKELALHHEVHVAVVEARHDRAAAGVPDGAPFGHGRPDFVFGADGLNEAGVVDEQGLGEFAPANVDLGVENGSGHVGAPVQKIEKKPQSIDAALDETPTAPLPEPGGKESHRSFRCAQVRRACLRSPFGGSAFRASSRDAS